MYSPHQQAVGAMVEIFTTLVQASGQPLHVDGPSGDLISDLPTNFGHHAPDPAP